MLDLSDRRNAMAQHWWLSIAALLILLSSWTMAVAQPICRKVRINNQGVAGADITISTSPVQVVVQQSGRCGFVLINQTANGYRCANTTGTNALTPTQTVGVGYPGGTVPVYGPEGADAWACIRTGASDAILSVQEFLP